MKTKPYLYALFNKRMMQAMDHAGVRVSATSPSMVVLRWKHGKDGVDGEDPLHALIRHLEPSAVRGHKNMPSLAEATALGLIEEED